MWKTIFKILKIGSKIFKKWLIKCYTLGDAIITPTEYSKKLLQSYGIKNDIYVVSNGVELKNFQHDEKAGEKFREKYNAYNEKVTKLKDKVDRYENSKQSYDVRNDVEKLIIEFESCKHFDNAILKKLVEKIEINKNNTINIMFKI